MLRYFTYAIAEELGAEESFQFSKGDGVGSDVMLRDHRSGDQRV